MNNTFEWICGIIVAIAIGLGSWNLIATAGNCEKTAAQNVRIVAQEQRITRFEQRTEKKFDAIILKLDDIEKYIREHTE